MKRYIKKCLYALYPKHSLQKYNLQLAYIFHTEKIYEEAIFQNLLAFCKTYHQLTGAKPICTIIPPTNLLVKEALAKHHIVPQLFLDRLQQLAQVATIGYHGHFYLYHQTAYANGIHCNNFSVSALTQQLENDLAWFSKHEINHHGIYAGGWWFFNKYLAQLLLKHGFTVDFSFSKAPFFYNQYSHQLMKAHHILTGQSFSLGKRTNSLLCIQNFIGCSNYEQPLDFDRNMHKLLTPNHKKLINIGVINSHDYDINNRKTLDCITHLLTNANCQFHSADGLITLAKQQTNKVIALD